MSEPGKGWCDATVDLIVGNLLRGGVLLASAVVLIGGVLYLIQEGGQVPDTRVFHGEPAQLRSVGGVIQDALTGDGRGVIQLGLLLLIATPVARVAFSVVAFVVQRDRIYVVVTLIVLAVLLFSLFSEWL
jgi:uncharacterized membrane protein